MMDGAVSLQVAVASVAPRSPPPPCRCSREHGWISDAARVLFLARSRHCKNCGVKLSLKCFIRFLISCKYDQRREEITADKYNGGVTKRGIAD